MKEIILNQELIDQMIFAIENQNNTPFFDIETESLLYLESNQEINFEADPDRYWPLPEWKPANGFQLMKQFVGQLNNPVYQKKLSDALQSGKGVFRKFKDIIKESREIEKKWLLFKEKEMEKIILEWFEIYTESSVLDESGDAEEEVTDLILSDFTIELENGGHLELFSLWDSASWDEIFPGKTKKEKNFYIDRIRDSQPLSVNENSFILTALEPEGSPVGFIWSTVLEFDKNNRIGWFRQIYVLPEFRGLGIGKLLIEETVNYLKAVGINRIETILPPGKEFMEKIFKSAKIFPYSLWLSGDVS